MRYQNVLAFIVISLCSCFSFGSQVQAVQKPGAQDPTATILEFGIYEVVKTGIQYEHKESTAGYAQEAGEVRLVEKTTTIPTKRVTWLSGRQKDCLTCR
jgi:hypothetical protein